jgi:hypothetical protein
VSPVALTEPRRRERKKRQTRDAVARIAHLRCAHDHDHMVRALVTREGVDPETDLRPRIVAMAFAEQLVPALAGHWS